MTNDQKDALREYATALKEKGWVAAESVRFWYRSYYPDFDKWCDAVAVFLRAEEIFPEAPLIFDVVG